MSATSSDHPCSADIDATLIYMGYRGEDASRSRADSRRQTPWQSSSSTRPGAAGPWDDGSGGYSQDDGYATGNGYGGYPPDESYAGYEDYGADGGYAAGSGYGSANGYSDGSAGGYGSTGGYSAFTRDDEYPADGYGSRYGQDPGYGQDAGYGQGAGYGADGGYGQSGGYVQQGGGYGNGSYDEGGYGESRPGRRFGSGPYEQPTDPIRTTGANRIGGYRRPGGYPAIGSGSGMDSPSGGYRTAVGHTGAQDASPRHRGDAGNDWYNGQPAAASGSGFADTGVHNFAATLRDPVRGYPPAPGTPAAQLEAAATGLVHTGQQERYDDGEYAAYPGYGGRDVYNGQGGYDATGQYPAPVGYEDYDQPRPYDTRAYDTGRDYGEYDSDDPYQERYGDADPGLRPGGSGGKNKGPGKRGRRPLLLSVLAVVVVGVVGAAAYMFVFKHKPTQGSPAASSGPLPTSGPSASAATAACIKQLGEYCHIELRSDDPAPLTLAELFPPAFLNETDHMSFTRIGTKLDKTCSNAVIGQDLINALKGDGCTQVLRASYLSGDKTIMGTIGVINLATTNEAHHAGKVVGANDFITPLATSKGIGSKLGSGTGVVEAEFKGHYLILTWAEFVNGKAPSGAAQDTQLEQFESDLVAGSANIALSERMINGVSATTPAS